MCCVGQIVEKPRRNLEKVRPREDLKPSDVLKANPRVFLRNIPRHSDSPERGLFQILS